MPKKRSIRARLFGIIALMCIATGCHQDSTDVGETAKAEIATFPEGTETKEAKLSKAIGAKETGDVVFAIKDGKAMVLLDLQLEAESLVRLPPAEREIHLLKRAFVNLEHKTMARSPFKDKDRCVVRMVMLTAIDQYNRPVWGSAVEIANFEIDLAKVRQTGKSVTVLKQESVAEFFVSHTVIQDNIKEYQVGRIKIK